MAKLERFELDILSTLAHLKEENPDADIRIGFYVDGELNQLLDDKDVVEEREKAGTFVTTKGVAILSDAPTTIN